MTLLRNKDLRAMGIEELEGVLKDQRSELMHENGLAAMGGAPQNPGKIRALRTNIARLMTIRAEKRKGGKR